MGHTSTEKILMKACGKELQQGEIVDVPVGRMLLIDLAASNIEEVFVELGSEKVYCPEKVVCVPDHCGVQHNLKRAELAKQLREFAGKHGLQYYEIGRGGIGHQIMVEDGWVKPGMVVVGSDSHSTTYGAVGAVGIAISQTEAAVALSMGTVWMRVPEAIRIVFKGEKQFAVTGKDVSLKLMNILGYEDIASFRSIEFVGEGLKQLTISDRMAICNMMCEAGAKNAIFPPDYIIQEYTSEDPATFSDCLPDDDAVYVADYEVDLTDLEPLVASPHQASNIHNVQEVAGTKINQAFLGSCTSGRLDELETAAKICKGRKVADGVIFIVCPASWKIQKEAIKLGYLQTLIEAGACVETPSCASCAGAHTGVLPKGSVCVSTSNRNFKGRMGSSDSEIYLASAATVAASAIEGAITDPRTYLK